MRRLFAFLAVLLLAFGLVFGSTAHAYEAAACIEPCSVSDGGLVVSVSDPAPDKPGKCAPGHCCCCHGHHVGVTVTPDPLAQVAEVRVAPVAAKIGQRALGIPNPALRPPQA
jgi:hypothetical protein